MGETGFVFCVQPVDHGGANSIKAGHHQWIKNIVEGVAERRTGNHSTCRTCLVMVVHDLREPFDEELAVHVDGLAEVGHVEIAIVVVAGVFFVEAGSAVHDAFFGDGFAHVPFADEVVAIGIGMDAENDDVLEDAHRLGVSAARELPNGLDELVGADGFGGMETAVDPDDGFAFGGEGAGLFFGEAFGAGESLGDALVLGEVGEVLGGRDDHHVLGTIFFGFTDVDEAQPIGFRG